MYEYKRIKVTFLKEEDIEKYLNELGKDNWKILDIKEEYSNNLYNIKCICIKDL